MAAELPISEATFSIEIENISKLKDNETILSSPCYIQNLPFRIMIMPRVDSTQPNKKALGFFLQCNAESTSTSWSCKAAAEYRLKSFKAEEESLVRKALHLFYHEESDWGFSYFISWAEIFNKNKGFVQNDTIEVEVRVVAEPPEGEI